MPRLQQNIENRPRSFHSFMIIAIVILSSALLGHNFAFAKTPHVVVTEKTKFYTIQADTTAGLALQMDRRGPDVRRSRQQVWAKTQRTTSYRLIKETKSRLCHVVGAKVTTELTYTLPKVRNLKQLSKSHQARWKKIYALLVKHEHVHGRYYRQFSHDLQKKLARLPPLSNCFKVERAAKKLLKKLSKKNQALNRRFDRRDKATYRRVNKLITH